MGMKGYSSRVNYAPDPPEQDLKPQANISEEDYLAEKTDLLDTIDELKAELEALKKKSRPSHKFFEAIGLDRRDEDEGTLLIPEGFKVTREAVFEAVDTEREHALRIGYGPASVGEYLSLIHFYYQKALSDWGCGEKPPLDELDQIRKLVSAGVACMEAHGAPPRVKSKIHPIPGQPDKHADR